MNCLTFRRRGCGPEGDRSKAGRANTEVTMHENIRLTKRDGWIASIWQMQSDLDEAISTSPLEHLERRVVALEQKCGAPVIHSRTETKIRQVQNNEMRTSFGAARIYL